jgi:hypothetical protein
MTRMGIKLKEKTPHIINMGRKSEHSWGVKALAIKSGAETCDL